MQTCKKFKVLIIPGEVFFFVDLKNSITSEANCNIILTARSERVTLRLKRSLIRTCQNFNYFRSLFLGEDDRAGIGFFCLGCNSFGC